MLQKAILQLLSATLRFSDLELRLLQHRLMERVLSVMHLDQPYEYICYVEIVKNMKI